MLFLSLKMLTMQFSFYKAKLFCELILLLKLRNVAFKNKSEVVTLLEWFSFLL